MRRTAQKRLRAGIPICLSGFNIQAEGYITFKSHMKFFSMICKKLFQKTQKLAGVHIKIQKINNKKNWCNGITEKREGLSNGL